DVALAIDSKSQADDRTDLHVRRPQRSHHCGQLLAHFGTEAALGVLPRLAGCAVRKIVGQRAALPQGASGVVPGKGALIIAVQIELVEDADWSSLAAARGGDVQHVGTRSAPGERACIARV